MQFGHYVWLAAIIAPALASAQKPHILTKPEAEYPEPFSQILGVRELRDGRVLVSDMRSRLLQIIDFNGSATNVAREGSGPGEFAVPAQVVALPSDTSAVYDRGHARYLLVHPDGKPGRHFQLAAPGNVPVRVGPRGVDARGSIYYQALPLQQDASGKLTPAESVAVVRFDRAAMRADTVAFVRLAKGHTSVTAAPGGGVNVSSGLGNPLIPRDDWVVLPDGRVAVVRPDPYRIDFYTSRSHHTSGAPVAYEKIRVDGAVRQFIEDERTRTWRNAVAGGRGRDGAPSQQSGRPPNPPPLSDDWPSVMPPFLAQAAVARPNGHVWVLRTQKPGNAEPLYDVFDGTGRVVGHVLLPPRTSLIGFGRGTIYLIRRDEDDLQYLQRYRLAPI